MKILLVTEWFDPEPNNLKALPFANALRNRGNQVAVLTGFPNYPLGHTYDGYRQSLVRHEMMDGIPVTRVPLFPSHDLSARHRVMTYASFALSASFLGLFSRFQPDVIYVYWPPPTAAIPAWLLSNLSHCALVIDVQDLWPDLISSTGMSQSKALIRRVAALCHYFYRRADAVVTLSRGYRDLVVQRGAQARSTHVIPNWCDESLWIPLRERRTCMRQANVSKPYFDVLFAGNVGPAQDLDTLVDAAVILAERVPRVRITVVGGGTEQGRLQKRSQDMGLQNIRFLPRRSQADMVDLYLVADAGFVHLRNDAVSQMTIPSKTQVYMALGLPLVMGVQGDAADLARGANCGICCRSGDATDVALAIELISETSSDDLRAMGDSAERYYDAHLSLDAGVSSFCRVFESAIRQHRHQDTQCCIGG